MNWFLEPLKKYAVFSGRARRMEYWVFNLGLLVIYLLLVILIAVEEGAMVLLLLTVLGGLLPGLAVTVRRLHDTGRSGRWFLISFIPIVGGIWLLVLTVLDSEPGENQYGPNPKGVAALVAASPPAPGSTPSSAEETVRQRYARGEIDAETLNQMLDEIRHSFGKRRADVGVGVVGGQPGRIPARPPYACPKCGSTSVRRALIGATVQCKEAECRHIFDWSR